MSSSINLVLEGWKIAYRFRFLVGLLLIAFFITNVYLTRDCSSSNQTRHLERESSSSVNGCDLFSGAWVYDNQSYPLYKEKSCSFMVDDYACQKFGREDFKYQHWKWQPRDCDLPRFPSLPLSLSLINTYVLHGLDGTCEKLF